MSSRFLSIRALRGLSRVGDVMLPGGYGFPRFSDTGCISHVDELMAATPEQDVKDFNLLMTVLSIAPEPVIRWMLEWVKHADRFPKPIAPLLRLLHVGVYGVVYSLYYSGKNGEFQAGVSTHEVIAYQVRCEPVPDSALQANQITSQINTKNTQGSTKR